MRLKPYMLLVLPKQEIDTPLLSLLKEKFGHKYFVMPFSEPEKALAFLHSRKDIARLDLIVTKQSKPYGIGLLNEVKSIFPKSYALYTGSQDEFEELMPSIQSGADGFLIEPETDPETYLYPVVEKLISRASMDEHLHWQRMLPGYKEQPARSIKIIRATSQEELRACFELRYDVWHREFKTLPENYFRYDFDGYDPLSIHILALVDGVAAGTVRMIPCRTGSPVLLPCEDLFSLDPYRSKNIGEISRLVLKKEFRNGVIGRQMIKAMLACSACEGYFDFYGSANPRYKGYYEKMGMRVLQERILDYDGFGGLPAIPMTLRLDELSLSEMRSWGMPESEISLKPSDMEPHAIA
ncbi:MAG: GNAT family N-acetyltransferase [Cyclobacteriaceae bacterium]